jgi:hypothetical protein
MSQLTAENQRTIPIPVRTAVEAEDQGDCDGVGTGQKRRDAFHISAMGDEE